MILSLSRRGRKLLILKESKCTGKKNNVVLGSITTSSMSVVVIASSGESVLQAG